VRLVCSFAYRSGDVSGLLHGLRGLGEERPEDLEVVGVDRVQLEPCVDAFDRCDLDSLVSLVR
jgi:hypothetical protein